MERWLKYGLTLAVLAIGILLLFVHIGIFVFIYLPVCLTLVVIVVVRSKRAPRKPEKPKLEAKKRTVKVPKYPKVRRVLGLVVLVTIFPITPLLFYLTGELFPFLFVMFIDPMMASFVYPGVVTGLYFLISKRVRRLLGFVLMIIAGLYQLIGLLIFFAHLIEGYPIQMFLLPMFILVPASVIYSVIEPARKQGPPTLDKTIDIKE